jgi:hypothetical protein
MIRSRRLALAAVVVVLGLAACGDPNTTTPLADGPPVIQLASGQGGAFEAAPAAASIDAADSKMAFFAPTDFVYDGELPALDGPAGSWFFASGQQADLDRVAQLAAALGAEGEVRVLPTDQGGGWAVGPEDYSAPVLTVGSDGMLSWGFSGAPVTSAGFACVEAVSSVDPASDSSVADSSGGAAGVATPAPAGEPTTVVVAPDTPVTDCPTPQPPPGVPTKDEALAKAKQLFADWGYDINSYEFDEPYADEWSASVNASLLVDGMKAPVTLSVGFGENSSVTYASGYLGVPERGADYPTIGAAAGLERLKEQQSQYLGLGAPGVRSATDAGVAIGAPEVAPDIAPCEPGPAVDCAPIDAEPVTIHLNSVKADLTMVWASDNTIWLLPAYSFGAADGGIYSVIAVQDAFIQQSEPAIVTDPGVDPGLVPTPETAVAVPPNAAGCATVASGTEPALSVEQVAEAVVGHCLTDAQKLAERYGYQVRVVRQDGEDLAATADFSESRINVSVKGDIVIEVVSIG